MLYVEADGTIRLTRGDTARLSLDIRKCRTEEEYVLAPGDILRFTIKRSVEDSNTILQKVLKETTTLHLLPEDTADLPYGKYKYDIELTTETGDVYTIVEPSTFELMKEVTF